MNPQRDIGDVKGLTDAETGAQNDLEFINTKVFTFTPDLLGGVPTTLIGFPAVNFHILGEKWVDVYLAEWVCTAQGTPGTWAQVKPALVANNTVVTSPSTNYVISDQSNHLKLYYWSGAAWLAV